MKYVTTKNGDTKIEFAIRNADFRPKITRNPPILATIESIFARFDRTGGPIDSRERTQKNPEEKWENYEIIE